MKLACIFFSVLLLSLFVTGCAGMSSSVNPNTNNPQPPSIAITITPATATVRTGAVFNAFVATVTNTSNTAVNWTVDNVAGGNTAAGTIDTSGRYTAPASPGSHTVTVISQADTSKSATAQVTVTPPFTVTIAPASATVKAKATQQFVATVTPASNQGVVWSVDSVAGGNSTVGTVDASGLYAAPSTSGTHTVTATSKDDPGKSASAQVTLLQADFGPVSVLTYHNDGQRTGLNANEAILTPSNVNSRMFGKLFSYPVDGKMYAQPLYVSHLANIAGATHNVVFAATEHNTVYAFDADGLSSFPLWQKNLGPSEPSSDVEGVSPELGITGTPVIDDATDTLYVVAETKGGIFNLHALDLHDGSEKFGGPVVVTATVPGTGEESINGKVTLGTDCYQRPALALVDNTVFIAFGHCAHGWILGYTPETLAQVSKMNTTPDGAGGTIWMSGGGPATDGLGNLYVITAVDFGDPSSGFNDSFLKLNAADLTIKDFFVPSDEAYLRANDGDLGSGAPLVLPDNPSAHPHEVVGGGKDGRVFLVDRDGMGGFNPPTDPACDGTASPPASCDKNVQTLPNIGNAEFDNIFATPAYWNGLLYYHPQGAALQAFSYGNGMLSTAIASAGLTFGDHGATPSISANGTNVGIIWELQVDLWDSKGPAILRAYDASNLANELYDSSQAAIGRDAAGPAVKFTVPTVVNGRVYVGTATELDVYGLISP